MSSSDNEETIDRNCSKKEKASLNEIKKEFESLTLKFLEKQMIGD